MIRILRFNIDLISFLIGVVFAALIGLLFWGLKRLISSLKTTWKESAQAANIKRQKSLEEAYLQVIRNKAQRHHIAFELFALEEILVEPRVILPPPITDPVNPVFAGNILEEIIPFSPDYPEFISQYPIATHSLSEVTRNGGHFFILGQTGSGKSTALASLALHLTELKIDSDNKSFFLPIHLDIHELELEKINGSEPFTLIKQAAIKQFPKPVHKELNSLLDSYLNSKKIVLLLDSIDEQSPKELENTEKFMQMLLKLYPQISIISAGFGKSVQLFLKYCFSPLILASWNKDEIQSFIKKWHAHWEIETTPSSNEVEIKREVDWRLLAQWLQEKERMRSPLEWTLKTWAVFAHDLTGTSQKECLKAYSNRICDPATQDNLLKLIDEMIDKESSSLSFQFVRSKLSSEKLTDLLSRGFLDLYQDDRVVFCNSMIAGFFASGLPTQFAPDDVSKTLNWNLLFECTRQNLMDDSAKSILNSFDISKDHPLFTDLLQLNRLFTNPTINSETCGVLLKYLYSAIQNEELSLGLRINLLSAILIHSGNAKSLLLRELSKSNSEIVQQLTALGIGFIQDDKLLPVLESLANEDNSLVKGSAFYALAQFSQATSTDLITDALMNGDEKTKLFAAGALSTHSEGHEILKKTAKAKDILVRRAVVQSISNIRADWVIPFLTQISLEDDQWIVRNVAVNALEQIQSGTPNTIKELPNPSDAGWLIQVASAKGVGIPVGRPPIALLLDLLNSGSLEEQLGALDYLKLIPENEVIRAIYQKFLGPENVIREKAYYCLWFMQLSGNNIQSIVG
jgi:HEAT repeat protein/energy-coupling factor transporter ATP-binding protein EcfA2